MYSKAVEIVFICMVETWSGLVCLWPVPKWFFDFQNSNKISGGSTVLDKSYFELLRYFIRLGWRTCKRSAIKMSHHFSNNYPVLFFFFLVWDFFPRFMNDNIIVFWNKCPLAQKFFGTKYYIPLKSWFKHSLIY